METYGSWKSSISTEQVAGEVLSLGFPFIDDQNIFWLESRPKEKGRSVLMTLTKSGNKKEVLSKECNVRSKVHEYGGGSYFVHKENIFFVNAKDQRIYWLKGSSNPRPITPQGPFRYANGVFDERRNFLYYVREEHTENEVLHTLVKIDLNDPEKQDVIASGYDFYSNPVISPNGEYLAYICWNNPHMPWDESKLLLHEIKSDGSLHTGICVAGGVNESIFQPRFAPDNALFFVSDKSGFGNLYRYQNDKVFCMLPMEADFGQPAWLFGFSTYDFVVDADHYDIVCTYTEKGVCKLAFLSLKDLDLKTIDLPFTSFEYIHAEKNKVVFLVGSKKEPKSIVLLDLGDFQFEIIKRSQEDLLDPKIISIGQEVAFPSEEGLEAYGIFYPPLNPQYIGKESERPPLIVKCHGGPTMHVPNIFNMEVQFWTSRGFGYLIVNYGGSTGYGREYRQRLNGNWGVVDVNDCCSGALHLAHLGLVDRERMVIKGSSAGGYTALASLCFRDVFSAGVSYYGIADLEKLQETTHKFEAYYNDSLLGPYPESQKLYRERSPIHSVQNIKKPVLLFQGLDDKVVPPSQAEKMFKALKKQDIPTALITFEGEGHGFRKSENMQKALEEELHFYSEIFDIPMEKNN